jgi:hypothetical protein
MRQLAEFCRGIEPALLVQDGIDVGALGIDNGFIGHDENLDAEELFSCRKQGTRSQEFILQSAKPDVIGITRRSVCLRQSGITAEGTGEPGNLLPGM